MRLPLAAFVRPLAGPVIALLALIGLPLAAQAQCILQPDGTYWCDDGNGPGGNNEPGIFLTPGTMRVSQPAVAVSITMTDDVDLADTTFHVYVNGVDVTASFSYAETNSNTDVHARPGHVHRIRDAVDDGAHAGVRVHLRHRAAAGVQQQPDRRLHAGAAGGWRSRRTATPRR